VKSLNCSAHATAPKSYAAGVIGLTDVLDADRQLLAAKDDLAVARESVARAAIGSYRALGGGWLL
jgi:outer membrane protein TolC